MKMSIFALIRGVFIAALMMVMSVGTVYSQSEEDEDPAQAGRLGDLSNIKDFKELSGMAGRLAPHGDDLMGDMIDKNTGGISFQHTDISIPGNSGLEVALRRKRSQGTPTFSPFQNGFGDWDIELPIAYIAYAQNVEDNGNPDPTFDDGCLRNSGPMVRDARAGSRGGSVDISSDIHTSGSILYIPGQGLSGYPGSLHSPSDFKSDWRSNGTTTDFEGRCATVVRAPDGTKYKFGRHTLREAKYLKLPHEYTECTGRPVSTCLDHKVTIFLSRKHAVYLITEVEDIHGNYVRYEYTDDDRAELTRIYSDDDREINIHYESFVPLSHTRNSRRISHVIANGRRWDYEYIASNGDVSTNSVPGLYKVTLPDGRFWRFGDSFGIDAMYREPHQYYKCVPWDISFDMKHPDGAIGTFRLRETRHIKGATTLGHTRGDSIGHYMKPTIIPHIRYNTPSSTYNNTDAGVDVSDYADDNCSDPDDDACDPNYSEDYVEPVRSSSNPSDSDIDETCRNGTRFENSNQVREFPWERPTGWPIYQAMSIASKTISAPGQTMATWDFKYRDYDGGELDNNWTEITEPDGTKRTYTYEAVGLNFGLLKSVEVAPTNGAGETVSYEHKQHSGVSYCAAETGQSEGAQAGLCQSYYKRPVTKMTHERDEVTYTSEYRYDFSEAANFSSGPVSIKKFSTLTGETNARETLITYEDKIDVGVLDLPKKVTRNGVEIRDNTYNDIGQLTQQKRFGDDYESYTYHADGNVHTVTDALDRVYKLENYYRGNPRRIVRPDGNDLEATFDTNGWLERVTNARGYTTSYDYNDAGWLTKIDPPAPWAATNISYDNVGEGIVQTETRGSVRTVTTHDRMHRPVLVKTEPVSNGGLTTYVNTQYDGLGRAIFTSRPSTSHGSTNGTRTTYDGLGRVTQTLDTAINTPITRTEYLSGNRMRVTDALGNVTTTTRSGYGSPNDGNPTFIAQPENINTAMTYDLFGNLLTARQFGQSDSYSADETQTWVYDDELRLCRSHTPETGWSVYQYDDVDNVIGLFKGQPSGTNCNLTSSDDKITTTYDELNRPINVDYGSGNPELDYRYDANGNVTRIESNGSGQQFVNSYRYDTADNLTRESIGSDTIHGIYDLGGEDEEDDYLYFRADYTYDPNGFMTHMRTPLNRNIEYTNNGLGQVVSVTAGGRNNDTGVTASASNMIYHPSGALQQMLHGNEQWMTTNQNSRHLTTRIFVRNSDESALDIRYTYDWLNRVTSETDSVDPNENRVYTYDRAGRLIAATGPWGEGSYKYDALGNIREKRLGNRRVVVGYNGRNQVWGVRDTFAGVQGNPYQLFAHDLYGNVINNGRISHNSTAINESRVTIGYDGAFPLPTSMSGGVEATYAYDGNNRRAYQNIDGEETFTFYSQSGAILLRSALEANRRNDDSIRINRPDIYTDYIRAGGKTIARVQRRAGESEEEVTYMHQNHLGSPLATTDADGQQLWRESYTPFGEKWQSDGDNDDNVSFTGHIHDTKSNLTYMQARFYDPTIGRFLSVDPVTFMDKPYPGQFNRYAYTWNDPINANDPDGEFLNFVIGAAIGAAIETGSQLIANGGDFSALDGGAILKSGGVGALTGGIGGALAKQGATRAIGGLSNQAKGRLGETIVRGKLALKGQKVIATQTKASQVPGLQNVTGRGANSVVDFAVKGKNGATKVIDAKFTTTGKVSNTGAQRHLKSQIGDNFSNAVVHADDVATAAGRAGAVVGGAAGGGASTAHNRCQDNGNC